MFIHLSDINIGGPRTPEYETVFVTLREQLATLPDCIVVIAGNVFYRKTYFTSEDIKCFYGLIAAFGDREIIIIPGANDKLAGSDLMASLARLPRVHYWNTHGVYTLAGCKFVYVDGELLPPADPSAYLLFNGDIPEEYAGGFAAGFLGGKCDVKIEAKWAYPGCLLQQSGAESITKGYVVWGGGTPTPSFVELPTDRMFLSLDVADKTIDETRAIIDLMAAASTTKTIIRSFARISSEEQADMIFSKFGSFDSVERTALTCHGRNILNPEDVAGEFRAALHANVSNLTDEAAEPIVAEFMQTVMQQKQVKWTILSLKWQNYYKYDHGEIDFQSRGLYGVVAPNCSGKSSIIDIIMLALFNSPRGRREDVIRAGTRGASLELKFGIGETVYTVTREDTITRATVTLAKDGVSVPGDLRATYAAITALIGTSATFCMTSLYNTTSDIFSLTPAALQRAIPPMFGLVGCDAMATRAAATAKAAETELASLIAPRVAQVTPIITSDGLIAEKTTLIEQIRGIDAAIAASTQKVMGVTARAINARLATLSGDAGVVDITDTATHLAAWKTAIAAVPDMPDAAPISCEPRDISAGDQLRDLLWVKGMLGRKTFAPTECVNVIGIREAYVAWTALPPGQKHDVSAPPAVSIAAPTYNPLHELATAQARVKELESASSMLFSQTCDRCDYNKKLFCGELISAEANLARVQQLADEWRLYAEAKDSAAKWKANGDFEAKQRAEAVLAAAITSAERSCDTSLLAGRIAYAREQIAALESIITRSTKATADSAARMRLLEALPAAVESDCAREEIAALQTQKTTLDARRVALDAEIARVDAAAKTAARENEIYERYHAVAPGATARAALANAIVRLLKSEKFRVVAVAGHLRQIIALANSIMRRVVDFGIEVCIGDDGSICFNIMEASGLVDIMRGSNFQKFMTSIAFRLALCRAFPCSGEFVFFDEGFGTIDEVNLPRVGELLASVAQDYKFLFVISHAREINAMITHRISIVTRGTVSTIGTPADVVPNPVVEVPIAMYNCACGSAIANTTSAINAHKRSSKHKKFEAAH